jgi:hypothetical protein
VRPEGEVKKVAIPQAEETYILCRPPRPQGERESDPTSFLGAHGDALKRLAKTIATGRLKGRNQMERRLGRIPASHSQVNDLYKVALRETHDGIRLHWEIKQDRKVWRELREGAYLLRTNLQAGTAEELWSQLSANRSRGLVPYAEKRAIHPPLIPSTGATGQSPCSMRTRMYGGVAGWVKKRESVVLYER